MRPRGAEVRLWRKTEVALAFDYCPKIAQADLVNDGISISFTAQLVERRPQRRRTRDRRDDGADQRQRDEDQERRQEGRRPASHRRRRADAEDQRREW